ncbi:MAG TPA: TonB-dependent siderophore receptor [Steroidobacter sp.]|uniref:TonB-dependent receptor family protein n=1 Tax=Steroidobacter sp. TaxID=1978227 RepID=UPI002ED91FA8
MVTNTLPRRRSHCLRTQVLILAGGSFVANLPAFAEEIDVSRLPTIVVVGHAESDIARQPGAVTIVTTEELTLKQPRSTEEALRTVPGVTIKPEEETAIVANIGVRGLSSADYKTLILEDGVPVAPGLFVGNGRYYNPRVQRMEGIEILKGAASLRYGPSTIGGVINYITKQPRDGVELAVRTGSFNTREASLELGASTASDEARFGALVTRARSDGFMDKGYDMTDVVLKMGLDIGSNQRLSIKYTDYDNDANISYRGLFLRDYQSGRDYNPAPDDWFLTGRRSLDLNHEWLIGDSARLNTLVYGSEMHRNYWRYATDNAASAAAGRWVYTDNLNGNNREFERFGVESRLQFEHAIFGIANEAELGLRYMDEEMQDRTVAATRATPRTGTINKDVIDSAESLAFYAQNRFLLTERFSVTAGLRAERYEQQRKDRRRSVAQGNQADSSNTELLPGLGVTYQFTPELQMYASVYKAFSPALNGDALNGLDDQQLDAERSVNIETGVRGGGKRLKYELALFRMQFDNQIIPANSNSQFQVTNGGKTLHQGIEAGLGLALGAGFSLNANATYIADAEFDGDRFTRDGTLSTPDGNRIPYTPEWVANLTLEHEIGGLRSALSLHHTGAQYTDVTNTREIAESLTGFFTGRIDSYTVLDLSLVYDVSRNLSFGGTIKNLTDERYIASLRQGIYVGPERSFDVAARYRF